MAKTSEKDGKQAKLMAQIVGVDDTVTGYGNTPEPEIFSTVLQTEVAI